MSVPSTRLMVVYDLNATLSLLVSTLYFTSSDCDFGDFSSVIVLGYTCHHKPRTSR